MVQCYVLERIFLIPGSSGFDLHLPSAIAVTQQEKLGMNLDEKWFLNDTSYLTEIETCL